MSRTQLMVVLLVLSVIGLAVVANSVAWGSAAANTYLRSQGGAMDASQFSIVLQEYIEIYRWIGSILTVIGGLGLVKTIEKR